MEVKKVSEIEKGLKDYCLFNNRHDTPKNEGAIFSEFDFKTFSGVKTEKYSELLQKGGRLYVTGLTPALTEFLIDFNKHNKKTLVLLHFNNETKEYVEQYC